MGQWVQESSRYALGIIRLINGAAALGMPRVVAHRLGIEGERGARYVLRLFGVRTVILGAELLFLQGKRLEWSVHVAPIIHASDTVSAILAGLCRQLPPRAAIFTVLISGTNTVLALLAQDPFRAARHAQGRDMHGGARAAWTWARAAGNKFSQLLKERARKW